MIIIVISIYLFAYAAPGVIEDGVLVTRHRRVQLLQHDLHTTAAVNEAPDVMHHGSFTERTGALVRRPRNKRHKQAQVQARLL